MRISARLNLEKTQHELDFVDIELNKDTPLFVDPHFIGQRQDPWAISANRTINDFFQTFLDLIGTGDVSTAREIFSYLGEPNETRLGLSKDKPRGHGIGPDDAEKIFQSLLGSKAIKTGVLSDIEDCRVFVQGIDKDKTSDMTTNIIRRHLIDYTNQQARLWGMPLRQDVQTGFFWDSSRHEWINDYDDALIIDEERILLVPKGIVTYSVDYAPDKYYRYFVLDYLQHKHLKMNSALVRTRTNKKGQIVKRYVTKKSLQEGEARYSKDYLVNFTAKHPKIFSDFKKVKRKGLGTAINNSTCEISVAEVATHIKDKLVAIPPGVKNATEYHRLIVGALELIFFPKLRSPQIEKDIHDDRKRIDITFDNSADEGFFYGLHRIHEIPCPYILVECKNYSRDVNNPELDQISGRFSPNRGKFGLVLSRSAKDMNTLLKRCEDTYKDQRGLIIPLVDADIIKILESLINNGNIAADMLLDRQRKICLS